MSQSIIAPQLKSKQKYPSIETNCKEGETKMLTAVPAEGYLALRQHRIFLCAAPIFFQGCVSPLPCPHFRFIATQLDDKIYPQISFYFLKEQMDALEKLVRKQRIPQTIRNGAVHSYRYVIAGMLGPNLVNAVISIAAVSWTKYARLARSMVLKVKKSLYIEAAVVNGTKTWKILLVHVLPNMVTQMVVTAAADIGTMMLELASLSFLGCCLQAC